MKFRLNEGFGEAYYRVGYSDRGQPLGLQYDNMLKSLKCVCYIAQSLKSDVIVQNVFQGKKGNVVFIKLIKIRKFVKLEIKIMLFGKTGSGKSTMLGVLLSNQLDDGNGLSRMKILRHKHEILTGMTSSLTYRVIGFNNEGDIQQGGFI